MNLVYEFASGIIDELMKKRSSLANKADENGWTQLHYAAYDNYDSSIVKNC